MKLSINDLIISLLSLFNLVLIHLEWSKRLLG